jgi:NTE family protein
MADVDLRTVPKLGLALGGGGVLGAAHVGVLQVLRERAIKPVMVAGTSAGSVMGAAFATGRDPYEMEHLVVGATWGDFGRLRRRPGLGLLDSEQLRLTIERIGGHDYQIEDLPIPYAAVATDARTGTAVVINSGSVIDAMRASIAVPGLFRPARRNGHVMVDGGLVQNLPLETVFDMGAEHVIGVRLAPEWDGLPGVRTAIQVHELEIDRRVTLITPRLAGRSEWVPKDIPGLIALGREAAEHVLRKYPVVVPRPEPGALPSAAEPTR